jgi:hypothetical protein
LAQLADAAWVAVLEALVHPVAAAPDVAPGYAAMVDQDRWVG